MPTEEKTRSVEQLKERLEGCSIAISADYTGMSVRAMTDLRRTLRERGVEFRVVKNRLAYLAADAAGKPLMKEIIQGPTGLAFGFDDPLQPAKALVEFIRTTRAAMKIRGGVLGDRSLTAAEVDALAALPPKEILIARLLGQLQAPITGLVYTINAPVSGLARVLQRRIETMEEPAEPGTSSESPTDSD